MVLKSQISPKITLVGAGPGDVELITYKGIKAIEQADVVLYDALASEDLLAHCKPSAELIFVGKRAGKACVSQEYINHLMVEKAFEKGHVVRLKGGDPTVFGRAWEEIEIARHNGIEPTIVPGVSSSIAAASSINVPITARGYSDSFWVITGTKTDHELSSDLILAAKSNATVVLLMGMSKLAQVQQIYLQEGKHDLPFLIIQEATTKSQKQMAGTMKALMEIQQQFQFSNPAVIIIGKVAALVEPSVLVNRILEMQNA